MSNREIDAMVAEHVMGWTNIRTADDSMRDPSTHEWWEDVWGDHPASGGNPHCVPNYTEDIRAAWGVVERMETDDFWFTLTRKTFTDRPIRTETVNAPERGPFWYARFRCVRAGTRGDHVEQADTPEMAISLAALRAVGVEVDPAA